MDSSGLWRSPLGLTTETPCDRLLFGAERKDPASLMSPKERDTAAHVGKKAFGTFCSRGPVDGRRFPKAV